MSYISKIDLSSETRASSITLLQVSLASAIDLSLQVKQAHWNIKGMNFIALHKYLDELHESVNSFVDTLAERITAFSGLAEGSLAQVTEKTTLTSYPTKELIAEGHLEALTTSIANLGAYIRKAIDISADKGDAGTSDIFTEISRELDHNLWLLEAHLKIK